jgi:hypothetical protein
MDVFLKILLGLVLLLLLIGLPLALSIWRGWWWKTVLLTWFIWVLYGACTPAIAKLLEKITGELPDADPFLAFFGGIISDVPALIYS